MSLGWKTLLRAICISAFAAVMMSMPVHAAKKSSYSAPSAAKQVSTRSAKAKVSSVKAKNTQRSAGERHKESRNSHRKESSQDRRHSRRGDDRNSSRESSRNRFHHEQRQSPEGRERRYNRHSRRRSRHYSHHSEFSGADYASTMTSDVVSKPHHPHGYTPRATDIAMTAMSLIGTPYRYGGNSPLTGLDCSGFVKYVYKETLDTNLPRTAAEMSRVGQPVSQNDLQPGDLVFYNTMRRSNSHVGIYLGDGRFIHSPRTGQRVRINSMDESYWRGRFNGARRIIGGQGIDRAKALQQYSREADTSPDTYNYDDSSDDPGEPPRERSVSRRHTERSLADTQKPADDIVVREPTVKETQSNDSNREVRRERRSRHGRVRHPERESRHQHAVKESADDHDSRRRREARHPAKEETRRHDARRKNTERDAKSRKDLRHRSREKDQEVNRARNPRRLDAKAERHDVRNPRKEKTADSRRHAEKAKAVKSIERKGASKEKPRRRR